MHLVEDPESGLRRGFGFVELPSQEQALRAVEDLEGHVIQGRPLHVESVPKPHRERFVGERLDP